MPLENAADLALAYTPYVADVCKAIHADPDQDKELTWKKSLVAVITDGSAVLGLGNIGARAAMPVMEGKCALIKKFAGMNAVPICLSTQDEDEIVETIIRMAPSFGAINLEDIAAPKCFAVERRLKERLDIPVVHDDQWGTAMVTLAGLINALQITGKKMGEVQIVMNGAGAAGIAIAKLLLHAGVQHLILCDSRGAIHSGREDLNTEKQEMLKLTNLNDEQGSLQDVLREKDVFIGVSAPDLLSAADIQTMAADPILFAMANPIPEILPEEAKKGGAAVVATGRSDFPNQVNNALVFPGLFQGLLEKKKTEVDLKMMQRVAEALAAVIPNPHPEKILPGIFDPGVAEAVAEAV